MTRAERELLLMMAGVLQCLLQRSARGGWALWGKKAQQYSDTMKAERLNKQIEAVIADLKALR